MGTAYWARNKLVIGSLWKPHYHTRESAQLVWNHPLECLHAPGWKGLANYRLLAGLLFIVMVILYIVF